MSNWQSQVKNNPYFCILPFTHMHLGTDSKARPCCVASWDEDIDSDISGKTLEEIWTSNEYQKLRRDMLDGKEVAACSGCYNIDKNGGGSDRVTHNKWFSPPNDEWEINPVTGNTNNNPIWMDLRPGRFCNLGCTMCAVGVSSTFAEEIKKYPELEEVTGQNYYDVNDWIEDETLYNSLQKMIPHIDTIKLAGGEPLFMPGVIKLLRWCVETGNTHLRLDITTNGTRSKGKVINWLEKFKRVDIQYSIDGIGYVNEYIRYMSKWDIINQNFNYYKTVDNIKTVNILATVQAYNAYDLINIFDYWENNCEHNLIFNLVDWPNDMSVDILPYDERQSIASDLENKAETLSTSRRQQSRIDAIIHRLRKDDVENIDDLRFSWAKRTKKYDEIRKNNIADVDLRLKEYMEEWMKIKK